MVFLAFGKNGLRWPQIGPGGFFPTNPDLADILGRTDLNFEKFYFFIFWTPNFQTPPPPPPPPPDELSDPNLTPLPTHPGIKYVARALAAIEDPTPLDTQLRGVPVLVNLAIRAHIK